MRTLRAALAATVSLALLGGLGSSVLAQAEEDAGPTVTQVTGEAVDARTVSQGAWSEVDGGGQDRGAVYEHDIEWSDPRLPSLMRLHENTNVYWLGDEGATFAWLSNVRLEDESGAWTGVEYGMGDESLAGMTLQPRMMLLTGEGAYEGLSAMLQRQHEVVTMGSSPVFEGYIFEGELPPMPEPLYPADE
jgi:hypothetical protein